MLGLVFGARLRRVQPARGRGGGGNLMWRNLEHVLGVCLEHAKTCQDEVSGTPRRPAAAPCCGCACGWCRSCGASLQRGVRRPTQADHSLF